MVDSTALRTVRYVSERTSDGSEAAFASFGTMASRDGSAPFSSIFTLASSKAVSPSVGAGA